MNHKKAKKKHFFSRWEERVGEKLTEEKYQILLDKVKKDGKSSVYRLKFDNLELKLAYDAFRNILVTVLL